MTYYVYIAFSEENQFQSVGLSMNLPRRLKLLCAQTKNPCKIVYYEEFDTSKEATSRHKELSALPKQLIKELVLENNPMLVDVL